MELEDLKEIVELFSKCNVDVMELEREGFSLKLGKKKPQLTLAAQSEVPSVAITAPPVAAVAATEEDDSSLLYVTSPIVGTFYRSSNPTSDPFVQVGSNVTAGQTLCIVEAMKLMNEIQSEHSGQIAKILVENGEGVEFGQKLFAIRSH